MYNSGTMMIMVCESPLHAGTGSDLDFIDKPIQRERHTQYPKIEASGLKGALRERLAKKHKGENKNPDMVSAFGPFEPDTGKEAQGALGFSDARLLLFPVKSMKGVFAWVTCPRVLKRFADDMKRLPNSEGIKINKVPLPESGNAFTFSKALQIETANEKSIVLEEFDFPCTIRKDIKIGETPVNEWLAETIYPKAVSGNSFWHNRLKNNLVILHDDDYNDFVAFTTEVITRNQINPDTGTVKQGHLFTEEYLPSDSVLYSLVMAHPEFKKEGGKSSDEILKIFTQTFENDCNMTFQAGGNASIGKGLLRAEFINLQTPKP